MTPWLNATCLAFLSLATLSPASWEAHLVASPDGLNTRQKIHYEKPAVERLANGDIAVTILAEKPFGEPVEKRFLIVKTKARLKTERRFEDLLDDWQWANHPEELGKKLASNPDLLAKEQARIKAAKAGNPIVAVQDLPGIEALVKKPVRFVIPKNDWDRTYLYWGFLPGTGIFGGEERIRYDLPAYIERLVPFGVKPHPDALPNQHAPGKVDVPALVPFIIADKGRLPGIVLDETDAELIGSWQYSTHTPPYVGIGYLHDRKQNKGKSAVVYRPDIPAAGTYEVRMSHCYNVRRATNTLVTVHHAGGATEQRVNQQDIPPRRKLFRSLGTFHFDQGKAKIVISNEGTAGKYVIADAIQLLAQEPEP